MLSIRPGNAKDKGCDSCHAETEQDTGKYEFVVASAIPLEYCHVCRCKTDVEDDEDGTNRGVDLVAGNATEASSSWWV